MQCVLADSLIHSLLSGRSSLDSVLLVVDRVYEEKDSIVVDHTVFTPFLLLFCSDTAEKCSTVAFSLFLLNLSLKCLSGFCCLALFFTTFGQWIS